MATSIPPHTQVSEQSDDEKIRQLQLSLPNDSWFGFPMYLYQGFWCLNFLFEGVIAFQNNFQAYDSDIILASLPKTGTTWLKSLLFAITNRNHISMANDTSQHPLCTKNPHELILSFEYDIYQKVIGNQPDLSQLPLPRLFNTHIPYMSLPVSIKTSKCKIVYVTRNPFDTFVSAWHFFLKFDVHKDLNPSMEMMEKYICKFCKGEYPLGPYEDHLLGYWKESNQNPQKVLFLEYEGLKKDPKTHVKRLAEFVGFPFSDEEKNESIIDKIIELCSFKNMKELEVNKNGKAIPYFENNAFFRKGEVNDWINYLTPSMANQIEDMLQKLKEAGFTFNHHQSTS